MRKYKETALMFDAMDCLFVVKYSCYTSLLWHIRVINFMQHFEKNVNIILNKQVATRLFGNILLSHSNHTVDI